jgi:hypothetical protein
MVVVGCLALEHILYYNEKLKVDSVAFKARVS